MTDRPHAVPAPPKEASEVHQSKQYKGDETFLPEDTQTEPPLTLYEKLKGDPYTVKYFNLTDWSYITRNPRLDESGVVEKVRTLEEVVAKEIERRSLIDSPESYRAIMQEIRQKLKIHPLEKDHVVFEKILNFFKRYRGKTAYGK